VPYEICILTGKRQILKKRVCKIFDFMIGKTATETSEILRLAFPEKTMSRTQTFD
jgi:hypothetical protein